MAALARAALWFLRVELVATLVVGVLLRSQATNLDDLADSALGLTYSGLLVLAWIGVLFLVIPVTGISLLRREGDDVLAASTALRPRRLAQPVRLSKIATIIGVSQQDITMIVGARGGRLFVIGSGLGSARRLMEATGVERARYRYLPEAAQVGIGIAIVLGAVVVAFAVIIGGLLLAVPEAFAS